MSRRSRAREVALQVLFQDDLNPGHSPAEADLFVRRRLREPELIEFSRTLISGVRRNRKELDEMLGKTADNWTIGRMAVADRNILRLGAYEILFYNTPDRVAINESVELAKRYGSGHSAQFVNGILDRFLAGHQKEKGAEPGNEEGAKETEKEEGEKGGGEEGKKNA
jgi:N utilization substance protein B